MLEIERDVVDAAVPTAADTGVDSIVVTSLQRNETRICFHQRQHLRKRWIGINKAARG